MNINRARFLRNLTAIAAIGLLPDEAGGGRDRRPFSPADREARALFTRLAEDAGLHVQVDAAANLSARLECGPAGAKTLLMGSHLDTVPHGGPYDGALGVMAGLEVLMAVQDAGVQLPFHLEVADFTDEEGRFGDFFGSRALTGAHTDATLDIFFDRSAAFAGDMEIMRALFATATLTAAGVETARRDPATLAGYLELHIEQGPRLEHAGVPIGVVSAIFGRRSFKVTFRGRPDHAGTTPLALRADALVAAAEFVQRAPQIVGQEFPDAVVTCGGMQVAPGVYNVVPDNVTLLLEFRAATVAELDGIDAALHDLAAEISAHPGLSHAWQPTSQHPPVPMHAAMQDAIRAAATEQGYASLDVPSGAGHDALLMAAITPTGMLFAPSIGGRSHCPDEDTRPDDLVAAAQVLLGSVLALAEFSHAA